MPQLNNGAAQGALAQQPATPAADATVPETLSAEDIRAIVAEQVRAALDPKALSSAIAPVVNAAVTNHLKRTSQGQQAEQAQQQGQQVQPGAQPNAAESKALQELAVLKEKLEAAERGRAETERKAAIDGARRSM